MTMELCLSFPDPAHIVVELIGNGRPQRTAPLPFASPLAEADQDELHWYLELYPVHYATELDDRRAAGIALRLEHWGRALFDAVFKQGYEAADLYQRFARAAEPGRLLSIDSGHPSVLAQPWELLRHPEGTWLFLANPRISTVMASTTRTDTWASGPPARSPRGCAPPWRGPATARPAPTRVICSLSTTMVKSIWSRLRCWATCSTSSRSRW
jgi:hypothetical protein